MIQKVSFHLVAKRSSLSYLVYGRIADRKFMIERLESKGDICDIKVVTKQISTGVEIRLPNVPQCLDKRRGVYTLREKRFKSKIAQQQLSDLQRKPSVP